MNILGWYGAKEWQKQLFASIATLSLFLNMGAGFFALPQIARADAPVREFSASTTPTSVSGGISETFTVTFTNSSSSTDPIKSGRVTLPTGFTIETSISPILSGVTNWDVCLATDEIQFGRNPSSGTEINPGDSFSVTFTATTTSSAGDHTFVARAFKNQSCNPGAGAEFDSNLTPITVTVDPDPNTPPVITLTGDNPLEITVGDSYVDPGATATDTEDGDITGDIVVGGDIVDADTIGSYVVTYNVTDSDGASATQVTRTVNVVAVVTQCNDGIDNDGDGDIDLDDSGCSSSEDDDENTPPVITITGSSDVTVTQGDSYSDDGSTADDVEDGNLTGSIVVGGDTVDTNTLGDYTITYNVTDSDGASATQVTRTVHVVAPDTGSIKGTKFNDSDNSGTSQGESEEGLSGWTIRVYDASGETWELATSTVTGVDGWYIFPELSLGEYKVCEVSQAGWEQTFVTTGIVNTSPNYEEEEPLCQTANLTESGDSPTRNFGNYEPPTTGTITVNKVLINDDGGSTATTSFSFLINGSSETSFEADGSNELTLSPDTYTITEVSASGYYTTYEGCLDIELGAGDSAVCTITNDDINEVSNTYVVKEANLVTLGELIASTTLYAQPKSWFFYNDENDTIDNALGSFVFGPDTAPLGEGSAEISVTGTERRNLATYQLSGIALADITEMKFSTYNPSAGNGGSSDRAAYINFNVDFDGSDDWQKRLAFVPRENGSVTQDGWQEWDAIDGGSALWWWSGFASNGNEWPDGDTNEYRTWSDLVSSFPSLSVRTTDSWFGFRVGEPYADGYTENIDKFVLGVQSGDTVTTNTFNFEPTTLCSVTVVSDETNTVSEKGGAFAEALSFIHTAWTAVIDGASWIWGDNPVSDPTVDETQTFVKTFDWNGTIGSAVLEIATDNYYTVKLNGVEIASEQSDANNFKLETQDTYSGTTVTDYIISGTNTLEIVVTNKGVDGSTSTSNPAGVKYSLVITGVDEGDSCMNPTEPTTATVTMCKYDTEDNPLEGWTLLLSGDHVQDLAVSSNSSAGTSSDPLSSGISYIASVAGTWFNAGGSGGAGNRADAEYVSTDDWSSYIDGPSTKPNQLDLQVNNEFVGWGPYNSNHNYAYSFIPSVDGAAVFRVFDGNADSNTPIANWYNDNSGSLDVSLNEGYAGITEENGCVQFEDVPVGSYTVGEIMQEGWMNVSGLGYVVVVAGENTFNVVNDLVPPDAPTLTIVKESVGYDGTFGFSIEGLDVDYSNELDIETLNGFGTSTTFSLEEGTYAVSEIVPTSWTLTNISCVYEGDGSSVSLDEDSEQLTLAGGDVVMCTFVNETNCNVETEHYDSEEGQCVPNELESYSDLELTKEVSDENPHRGDQVTYTLTLTNNGPHEAGNIQVEDLLPAGVTYVSHDAFSGTFATSTGIWSLISLGNEGQSTLEITVTVDDDLEYGTAIENIASITTSDSIDEESENDESTATFTVYAPQCSDGIDNDGDNAADYGVDPQCDSRDDDNEGPDPVNGGGGGLGGGITTLGGGIVLGASTSAGEVLGESCGLYMDQHLRLGYTGNNAEQVAKLQEFLNKYGYGFVPVTGFFGVPTENAVKAFQGDYRNEILTPWGINEPTGLVYLTTLRQINLIECPHLSLQIPPLVPWHLEGSSETFGQSETGTDTGVAAEQTEEEFVQEDDTAGSQTASAGDAMKGEKRGGFWSNVWNFFFSR